MGTICDMMSFQALCSKYGFKSANYELVSVKLPFSAYGYARVSQLASQVYGASMSMSLR